MGPRNLAQKVIQLSSRFWLSLPAVYFAGLILLNIISIPFATNEMLDDCPEYSYNCDYRIIALDVSTDELHEAMESWADQRSITTTFSEGHIVDRTFFMQFPDDVHYSNECGTVEIFSKSRLGVGDLGVNADRIDDIVSFLEEYDFKTTYQ